MNQHQKRRQQLPWFALSVISLIAIIVTPVVQRGAAAIAQTFNSDSSDRAHLYQRQLHPIDHQGFAYINQMGGGVDENGYYATPVPTQDAFGSALPNGTYAAPMQWSDQGTQVLYKVQDGVIVRQDYYWGGQQ